MLVGLYDFTWLAGWLAGWLLLQRSADRSQVRVQCMLLGGGRVYCPRACLHFALRASQRANNPKNVRNKFIDSISVLDLWI